MIMLNMLYSIQLEGNSRFLSFFPENPWNSLSQYAENVFYLRNNSSQTSASSSRFRFERESFRFLYQRLSNMDVDPFTPLFAAFIFDIVVEEEKTQ